MINSNKNPLTEDQKKKIKELFYRTTLREGEIIVDNSSAAISKELNIPKKKIQYFISKKL